MDEQVDTRDNAGGWQRFQIYASEQSSSSTAQRLDFMKLALRLNVSSDELRRAMFDSMDVVAVGQTNYAVGDANETTPLLRPGSQASLATTAAESVTLQTVPQRVTPGDHYRQDYLVLLGNVSEAPASPLRASPVLPRPDSLLSWNQPHRHSLSSLHSPLQLFPVPSFADLTPPATPNGCLTRDQRLQLLKVQEGAAVHSRSYSDQLLTSGVPTEAAAYGLKTGMQGFFVGQNEDCNLLHVPAAAQAPPGWLPRLWPSRIKSLRLVSYNADAEHEPTLFFSQVEYARPLIGQSLIEFDLVGTTEVAWRAGCSSSSPWQALP
eukprot:EG_transcript_15666